MSSSIVPQDSQNPLQFVFEGHEIRVVYDANGEPLFVATDVCKILEVGNASDAINRLDVDEKGIVSIYTVGGTQDVVAVTEPGLYMLVLGSRKPGAKPFKRWVAHDLIPQVRRTGNYISPTTNIFDTLRHMIDIAEDNSRRLSAVESTQVTHEQRIEKLEARPRKNYSTVHDYALRAKRDNLTPVLLEAMEQRAIELSEEFEYPMVVGEGNAVMYHNDVLKRFM